MNGRTLDFYGFYEIIVRQQKNTEIINKVLKCHHFLNHFRPGFLQDILGVGGIKICCNENFNQKEGANIMDERIKNLAERIYNTLAPWDQFDTSIEESIECLKNDPLAAVEYLLDIVENA